jgi:branched-chain amino acid transport system permease protein
MFAAFTYWQLRFAWGWPAPVALVLVLFVLAPALGATIETMIMRGLATARESTRVVVSVSLLSSLVGAALWLWRPTEPRPFPPFFVGSTVEVFGTVVTVHQLIALGCAAAVAAALAVLLRMTRLGIAMRAVVDDRRLLTLHGVRPDRVAMASWAIGSSLAALAGILIAPTLQLSVVPLTLLVVNAYAAAVIGRLRNLPLTFLGALLLGLAESYGIGYLPQDVAWLAQIRSAIPVLILLAALLLVPHARLRTSELRSGSDYLPAPRVSRTALFGLGLVAVSLLVAPTLSTGDIFTANRAMALAIVALSLVPLLGYAGQLSLCQLTFAGFGALTMAHTGGPGGLVLAFLVAAAVGAVIALPALRLQGIYLALVTAGFAVLVDRWFFGLPAIHPFGIKIPLFGNGAVRVERLVIGPVSFASAEAQLALLTTVFALFAVVIAALRRSHYGRVLLAMRDSPAACATLGLRLTVIKLAVFALSAGMAGVGGALLGGVYTSANASYFTFFQSLPLVLLTVVGGVGAIAGALLGGVLLGVFEVLSRNFPGLSDLLAIMPGLAGIGLARNPGGLASDLALAFGRRRSGSTSAAVADDVALEWVGIDRVVRRSDIVALDTALGLAE